MIEFSNKQMVYIAVRAEEGVIIDVVVFLDFFDAERAYDRWAEEAGVEYDSEIGDYDWSETGVHADIYPFSLGTLKKIGSA